MKRFVLEEEIVYFLERIIIQGMQIISQIFCKATHCIFLLKAYGVGAERRGTMLLEEHTEMSGLLNYFINLPEEKLLIVERKHWIVLCIPIVALFSASIPFYVALYLIFGYFFHYPAILISGILAILCVTISLIVKIIIDWYFHLFIISNKKILEVSYSPLFSYNANGVLLDQVRITEIDEKRRGILHELIDVGDITVTFDRPTHQEEFVFTEIQNPRKFAAELSKTFTSLSSANETSSNFPVWFRPRSSVSSAAPNKRIFTRYSIG